ncbi:hypothetical protein [Actinokineospora sp.]|uniref:hypothetical protein n=1 Tax=Actinokineospora sp. TaxID=1872133 RepID=UPI004037F4E8
MDGFRAEVDRLAERADEFAGLAEQADAIHRDLVDRLGAAGPCWGADEVGQSFSATHTAPADETVGSLAALPALIGDVGGRFADTARGYESGERDNTRLLGSSDA